MDLPTCQQLDELAARHGESFWLLDPARFRRNLDAFRAAFAEAGWPKTVVAWSLKTSWLPIIVRAAIEEGALVEVVSRHEYDLAAALGCNPIATIVNGPIKSAEDLDRACAAGARVHLDGPDEVANLLALARADRQRHFRVGLRANVDIGQPERGRFGLDAESGDLQRAFRELAAEPNIRLTGLHLHLSSERQAASFARRAERMVRLADELWPDSAGPEYLDLGGGFAGPMPASLAGQMPEPPAAFAESAGAIASVLRRRWPQEGPTLILEPGIGLAADTMRFAACVVATKTIAGVRHAIVAASVFAVKPTRHSLDMPLHVVPRLAREAAPMPTVVSGWTCMEDDVLSRHASFALERGDWVIADNCGAYSFVLCPPFIRPVPAVLVRDAAGAWVAARPADSARSWLAPFGESA